MLVKKVVSFFFCVLIFRSVFVSVSLHVYTCNRAQVMRQNTVGMLPSLNTTLKITQQTTGIILIYYLFIY